MTITDNTYVVSIGDAFNGLTLYGPFGDYDQALDWAEAHGEDSEWNIVLIQSPAAIEANQAA